MQQQNLSSQIQKKRHLICIYPPMVSCDNICIINWLHQNKLIQTFTKYMYKTYLLAWFLRSPLVNHCIYSSISLDEGWYVIPHPSNGKYRRTSSSNFCFPLSLDPKEVTYGDWIILEGILFLGAGVFEWLLTTISVVGISVGN